MVVSEVLAVETDMRAIQPIGLQPLSSPGSDWRDGAYEYLTCQGVRLRIITSFGFGWDHVSVSLPDRTPTWEEMVLVKSLFFTDEEPVIQFHVPLVWKINCHPHCLHLWRLQAGDIPLPPRWMVGSYPGWEHDIPDEFQMR